MKSVFMAAGVAAGMVLAGALSASAATISIGGPIDYFAKSVTYNDDVAAAGRGTADGRDNASNALGATDGKFFEVGLYDTVDFTFGTLFQGPGAVVEVTFGNRDSFPEFAEFEVGLNGLFTPIANNPISNQAAGPIALLFAGGPFDTLRVRTAAGSTVSDCGGYSCGGFDIDSVRVSAVPLPASVLLLLGALGGLGVVSRSRNKAI